MHVVLRATPLAFALVFARLDLGAQSEPLPPRSELRVGPAAALYRFAPSTPLVSDRMRSAITERLLAEAAGLSPSPAPPPTDSAAIDQPGGTVMMDRLVVKSSTIRVLNLPPRDSFLLKYIKTGTLYHHVGRTVETDIALRFLPVQVTGYGNAEASTRVELSFSFRW